ncbi:MAG: hypothetical protein A2X98_02745 [Deltaproteobacteria bacterium GWC2_66_88]|nr:MAG: hypothetical protein A2X98_02745 [Deltaproteobacteria bacterium GWC2_66_88]
MDYLIGIPAGPGNSLDPNRGYVEPEVWFRIVHAALENRNDGPGAACYAQTVEIALGPKGAFENGNIGALMRRVPANRMGSVIE